MMTKHFEATPVGLCQIDRGSVMGFRVFFCFFLNNLFSYLFISFSSITTRFEMNLSIWVAGDIKNMIFYSRYMD